MSQAPTLRVVHVIARLNMGGAALHVGHLAAEQRDRGYEVLVVAGTIPEGEESMEYLVDDLNLPFVKVSELQRELSVRADRSAVQSIVRIIRERAPHILHTHTAKAGGTGRIAALASGRARPEAVVHTYHGHVLAGYFSPRRESVYRAIERLLARQTSALIAVSVQVRDELVGMGIAPPDRFAVIPYGFDFADHVDPNETLRTRARAMLDVGAETFVVGWVGRLAPIKRPGDLVRTLKNLIDAGVDAVLCLVGDGPDRAKTEQLAEALQVRERVHFAGYQKDLAGWYAAFDALCLTSENEGTPVSAIEALASQRPVVATDVGGVPAVIDDGETGFLVPPGDVHGLAERLATLARDPGLRAEMGARGAARIGERYATKRMVDEIELVYRSCLDRKFA